MPLMRTEMAAQHCRDRPLYLARARSVGPRDGPVAADPEANHVMQGLQPHLPIREPSSHPPLPTIAPR